MPDPSTRSPGLPAELLQLLERMQAKDPARRPADGAAVVAELERLLGLATASTTAAARPQPAPARRHRLWWAAAGVAVTATILVGWGNAGGRTLTAVEPGPPPAAPPARAAGTPTRAVFVLAGQLPAAAQAGLAEACRLSGLPVVERSRVDALVAEQRLVVEGRIEARAAVQLGRLIGGHIALFAEPVENQVEVRCVLVETGELVACRLVQPDQVAAAVTAGITAALDQLPLQAPIERRPDAIVVLAGRRHGLRVGEQLAVQGPAGAATAKATVVSAEAGQAVVALDPAGADLAGASACRVAR